ncbi:MAG: hypothetical protein IPM45_00430 [Acidimicrobiales bacterium]|nr:hypothetical protein [Acidimicrobiales bacterium]
MPGPVALVTAAGARDLDEDLPPLLRALSVVGVRAEVAVWDDPAVDWARFGLVVVRSTWDYAARRDEFLAWAVAVEAVTRLRNRAAVLRWNTDKRYLGDLAAAGVPVPDSAWFAPGEAVALPPHEGLVVKPSVGAGSVDAGRYGAGERDDAAAHVARLQAGGRHALVQPYLTSVDEEGETALVYLGGVLSHAVRKGPLLVPGTSIVGGLFAEEDIRPRQPTDAQRRVAERALAAVPGGAATLLYGRVDLVAGPGGEPVVLELELTEPSVFLDHAPGAAERFAAAVAAASRRSADEA